MAQRRYRFLCQQYCFTDITMHTSTLPTTFCTGCRLGGINDNRMVLFKRIFLRHQLCTADAAVAAFGQTGLRAGRLYRRIDDDGMAEGGYRFLCDQFCAADAAVAAFAQAGAGTGGSNRIINHGIMAQRREFDLRQMDKTADMAAGTGCQSGAGTGGIDPFIEVILMSAGGRDGLLR